MLLKLYAIYTWALHSLASRSDRYTSREINLVTHFTEVPKLLWIQWRTTACLSGDQTPVIQPLANYFADRYIPAENCSKIKSHKLHPELAGGENVYCAYVTNDAFPKHRVESSLSLTLSKREATETPPVGYPYSHISAASATDAPCPHDRGPI